MSGQSLSQLRSAAEIVAALRLAPHPEGGFYRETFRDAAVDGTGRSRSTAIYFLLPREQKSAWHRVDAVESWHYYAGAPLALLISLDGATATRILLGPNLFDGEQPQFVVPAGAWQAAESLGDWTLVGCIVAPAFDFAGFEMAGEEFSPTVKL